MSKYSSPVPKGCRYTSGFMTKARPTHAGSDWAPPKPGQTGVKIHAVSDGKVVAAGTGVLAGHTGKIIVLDHGKRTGNGSTDHVLTNYGHLAEILVKEGQQVKVGEVIGIMGTTGNSSGIHLHLGVRFNGRWSDPKRWLKTKGIVPGSTAPLKSGPTPAKWIKDWQLSMNKVFPSYANFAGDGLFGSYSESVTKEFQGRAGLKKTGKLDESTKKAMRKYGVSV